MARRLNTYYNTYAIWCSVGGPSSSIPTLAPVEPYSTNCRRFEVLTSICKRCDFHAGDLQRVNANVSSRSASTLVWAESIHVHVKCVEIKPSGFLAAMCRNHTSCVVHVTGDSVSVIILAADLRAADDVAKPARCATVLRNAQWTIIGHLGKVVSDKLCSNHRSTTFYCWKRSACRNPCLQWV